MPPRREIAPKPFAWVSITERPLRTKPPRHDRWQPNTRTGTLDFTLTLLTPLHVGSGLFRLVDGQVVKEAYRAHDRLVIPGSSLKGVFRSAAEVISRSCMATERRSACRDKDNLCVCCRLFGGLGYLGRVRFTDAMLMSSIMPMVYEVPTLWSPRRRQRGRKFYKHGQPAVGGEPFEVVPENATFSFRADVESVTDAELCLLLTAMGVFGNLTPKLGGAKPRCLGSARVALTQARFCSPAEATTTYQRTDTLVMPEELQQQVRHARELIIAKALQELEAIWKHPGDEECPPDLY